MSHHLRVFVTICFIAFTVSGFTQEGQVIVNQNSNIDVLLDIKKQLNKTENSADRYKVQIYHGSRSGAYAAQKEFHESFSDWRSRIEYESPNFKIWAGNFRTRLEADRALKKIKKKFPSAFIFKPKKDKNG